MQLSIARTRSGFAETARSRSKRARSGSGAIGAP